jgi:hypothetical protein
LVAQESTVCVERGYQAGTAAFGLLDCSLSYFIIEIDNRYQYNEDRTKNTNEWKGKKATHERTEPAASS